MIVVTFSEDSIREVEGIRSTKWQCILIISFIPSSQVTFISYNTAARIEVNGVKVSREGNLLDILCGVFIFIVFTCNIPDVSV